MTLHVADEDLSRLELLPRNKRNRRKLYVQWIDSSVSLNGTRGSLFIFIRATIPMISGDFLTRWNGSQVSRTGQYGTNDKGKLKHSSVHAILFLAYVEIRLSRRVVDY